jgi:hypothetical protein
MYLIQWDGRFSQGEGRAGTAAALVKAAANSAGILCSAKNQQVLLTF